MLTLHVPPKERLVWFLVPRLDREVCSDPDWFPFSFVCVQCMDLLEFLGTSSEILINRDTFNPNIVMNNKKMYVLKNIHT